MPGYFEPDCGSAYYRTNDPIKNLQIRVRINKVSASGLIDDGDQAEASTSREGGIEMQPLLSKEKKKKKKNTESQEVIIKWQQKIFCEKEIEFYSKEENVVDDVLGKKYHEDVKALLNKKRQKNIVFTYVDHDKFSNQQEGFQTMTNFEEAPSALSVNMAEVRCRRIAGRQLRQKEQGSIPKTLIVEEKPSKDLLQKNHLEAPPIQVMYIMADLGPSDTAGEDIDEYMLCALKVDSNGVLSVTPDFTCGRKPYTIETFRTREGYDYTIENFSKEMSRQEQDKEVKMYREMYSRHNDFVQSCVGFNFERPPEDGMRYAVFGEIVSAQDFEKDNLYIQMFADLPKNWSAERSQQISWVTQSCRTKTVDQTEIAYFSFPFHCEFMYNKSQLAPKDEDEIPSFPKLMLEVSASDSWLRHFNEGYSFLQLPPKPGSYKETVHFWRPVKNSITDELRRFFIGGTPEIEDPAYTAVPSNFDQNSSSHLSKFGLRTQSTGSVTMSYNVILQCRAFMESKANKMSFSSLLDQLGVTAMQANISTVLEQFKRARMKMIQARDMATQELLREVRPIQKGELEEE